MEVIDEKYHQKKDEKTFGCKKMSVMEDLEKSNIVPFMNALTSFALGSENIDEVKADPFNPWPWF